MTGRLFLTVPQDLVSSSDREGGRESGRPTNRHGLNYVSFVSPLGLLVIVRSFTLLPLFSVTYLPTTSTQQPEHLVSLCVDKDSFLACPGRQEATEQTDVN